MAGAVTDERLEGRLFSIGLYTIIFMCNPCSKRRAAVLEFLLRRAVPLLRRGEARIGTLKRDRMSHLHLYIYMVYVLETHAT